MPDTPMQIANSSPGAEPTPVEADNTSFDEGFARRLNLDVEVEPEVEKPEEKPEPTPDPGPDIQGMWDKDRQRSDQNAATATRANEQLMGMVSTLQQQIATQSKPHDNTASEAAQAKKELDGMLAEIGEFEGGDKIAKALKAIAGKTDATGNTAALDAVAAQMKTLAEGQEQLSLAQAELAESNASRANNAALGEMLTALDGQFGAKYRTSAKEAVQQQLSDQGFDGDNLPHPGHVQLMLENEYRTQWSKDPKKAVDDAGKPKPSVLVDTGKGGSVIPKRGAQSDLKTVCANIKRRLAGGG